MKIYTFFVAIFLIFFINIIFYIDAFANNLRIHLQEINIHNISKNSYLHQNIMFTNRGIIDINTLILPLDEPMLEIGVFNSNIEYGLRQTTTNLLNSRDAIAGVNGDFFGLSGNFSLPLGFEARDGGIAASNSLNANSNSSASFMIHNGLASIRYIRPSVRLRLDGSYGFSVSELNRVADLRFPSFLTREYFENTRDLDYRFHAFKIVVENNIIVDIANQHRYVYVPYDGFVIIMDGRTFWANEYRFRIGGHAEMLVSANIDLDGVELAISGGRRILAGGNIIPISGSLSQTRHPRTILGINKEANQLILMTIDGRNHSIGATLAEAAQFIKNMGAYYAVNLDGGASTTMAASLPGQNMDVINSPSGSSQRAVINAIGMRRLAPLGEIYRIELELNRNTLTINEGIALVINGYDIYGNIYRNMDLDNFEIEFENALFYRGYFFPIYSPVSINIQKNIENLDYNYYENNDINLIQINKIIYAFENTDPIFREYLGLSGDFEFDIAFVPRGEIIDASFVYNHLNGFNRIEKEFAYILNIWTRNQSISAADPSQWGIISRIKYETESKNIIIFLDTSPSNFRHRQERDAFHNVMMELARAGLNVFIISEDSKYNIKFLDGVRYINFTKNSIVRLRIGINEFGEPTAKYTIEGL